MIASQINDTDKRVLKFIKANSGVSTKIISEKIAKSVSTIGHSITKLRKLNYVTSSRDLKDCRRSLYYYKQN